MGEEQYYCPFGTKLYEFGFFKVCVDTAVIYTTINQSLRYCKPNNTVFFFIRHFIWSNKNSFWIVKCL